MIEVGAGTRLCGVKRTREIEVEDLPEDSLRRQIVPDLSAEKEEAVTAVMRS